MSSFTKVILILRLLLLIAFIFKNNATYSAHSKIISAISDYNMVCIDQFKFEDMVEFSEMESYDKTLWRLNDWGHTNILPKEKFELVAPYIK